MSSCFLCKECARSASRSSLLLTPGPQWCRNERDRSVSVISILTASASGPPARRKNRPTGHIRPHKILCTTATRERNAQAERLDPPPPPPPKCSKDSSKVAKASKGHKDTLGLDCRGSGTCSTRRLIFLGSVVSCSSGSFSCHLVGGRMSCVWSSTEREIYHGNNTGAFALLRISIPRGDVGESHLWIEVRQTPNTGLGKIWVPIGPSDSWSYPPKWVSCTNVPAILKFQNWIGSILLLFRLQPRRAALGPNVSVQCDTILKSSRQFFPPARTTKPESSRPFGLHPFCYSSNSRCGHANVVAATFLDLLAILCWNHPSSRPFVLGTTTRCRRHKLVHSSPGQGRRRRH